MKIELKTQQQEEYTETELGPLPVEWSVVRIGDVFDVKQGKQLSSKESKEGKSLKPFLRTSNVLWGKINIANVDQMPFSTEEFNKLILKHSDVLVCEGGAIGRTALWNAPMAECAYQNHLHRLRVKKEGSIFPHFFVFWMEYAISQRRLYINDANVTTIPNLSQSRLKNFDILHPPLPEQHRIAAVLSAVQDAKEKTEAVIEAAKSLKRSLMRHLFTYGPVPAGAAESAVLAETEIGLVPDGWEVKPLVDIATLQRGKDLPKQNQIPGPYPIVGSSGVIGYHTEYVCVGPGVVTGRSGSIGKLTYVEREYWPHNTALYVKNFYANNPKFIYYLLHSLNFKKYATGVSVPTLNRNFIHSALLPLPPLPLQQKIANILSTVDKKIESEENKKSALDELFKSLLHNLMTGKIRVNHLEITQ